MPVPAKQQRRPLTATEEMLVDAFISSGDINTAAAACNLPIATATALLERPHIKRLVQTDEGYIPAAEMTDLALLDEILMISRNAAKQGSYAAAVAGMKLFYDVRKESSKEDQTIEVKSVDAIRGRLRSLKA